MTEGDAVKLLADLRERLARPDRPITSSRLIALNRANLRYLAHSPAIRSTVENSPFTTR